MTPQEALEDVCRRSCVNDSAGKRVHDDACSALRVALIERVMTERAVAQWAREVADEIERELICCPTDDMSEAEHSSCAGAIGARNLVLDRIIPPGEDR